VKTGFQSGTKRKACFASAPNKEKKLILSMGFLLEKRVPWRPQVLGQKKNILDKNFSDKKNSDKNFSDKKNSDKNFSDKIISDETRVKEMDLESEANRDPQIQAKNNRLHFFAQQSVQKNVSRFCRV
jgi:hypothetical protein